MLGCHRKDGSFLEGADADNMVCAGCWAPHASCFRLGQGGEIPGQYIRCSLAWWFSSPERPLQSVPKAPPRSREGPSNLSFAG